MNKPKILIFILIMTFIVFSSCKKSETDNSISPPGTIDNSNYFPSNAGNYYKYNLERNSSTGSGTTGTRDTRYTATTQGGGIYTLQTDTVIAGDSTFVNSSLFRKSDSGVYYFLDTTGFSANLPTEFISILPFLNIDSEMLLLSTPLQQGKGWPVFKVNLVQGITLTVVDVEASYLGNESVALNLLSGTVNKTAAKVQYNFSLINPINLSKQTVTAYGWYVADIGPVKWQGNGLLLNVFTGGEINFADSTTTGMESLIDYSVK